MINCVSFDIQDLGSYIDTSYEFVERLFKDLSTKISCEKDLTFSSSLYFHRHLLPSPDEDAIEFRRQSLSSYVGATSNRCLQSNLAVDVLSLVDCETECEEGRSLFSIGRTSSILLDDEPPSPAHLLHPNPLEALSAFYMLPNAMGHCALHVRPSLKSVSLDVFSLLPFDFRDICDVVALSFGVDKKDSVKVFSSVRGV